MTKKKKKDWTLIISWAGVVFSPALPILILIFFALLENFIPIKILDPIVELLIFGIPDFLIPLIQCDGLGCLVVNGIIYFGGSYLYWLAIWVLIVQGISKLILLYKSKNPKKKAKKKKKHR